MREAVSGEEYSHLVGGRGQNGRQKLEHKLVVKYK